MQVDRSAFYGRFPMPAWEMNRRINKEEEAYLSCDEIVN